MNAHGPSRPRLPRGRLSRGWRPDGRGDTQVWTRGRRRPSAHSATLALPPRDRHLGSWSERATARTACKEGSWESAQGRPGDETKERETLSCRRPAAETNRSQPTCAHVRTASRQGLPPRCPPHDTSSLDLTEELRGTLTDPKVQSDEPKQARVPDDPRWGRRSRS